MATVTSSVDIWTALGDRTRRDVLARVVERPRSVAEIARDLPVSRPAVSQHLRVLVDAELVTARQDGRRRIYRAEPRGLLQLRAESERFWSQALTTLKQISEETERAEGRVPTQPPSRREDPT